MKLEQINGMVIRQRGDSDFLKTTGFVPTNAQIMTFSLFFTINSFNGHFQTMVQILTCLKWNTSLLTWSCDKVTNCTLTGQVSLIPFISRKINTWWLRQIEITKVIKKTARPNKTIHKHYAPYLHFDSIWNDLKLDYKKMIYNTIQTIAREGLNAPTGNI